MTMQTYSSVDTCRLLILDDESAVGETIVNMAQASGIEARATNNAAAFFRQIYKFDPTHVAIDLMMPSLDGIGVIRRLAETNIKLAVIIISGASPRVLEAARRSAVEHGLSVVGVLGKPFSRKDLIGSLQIGDGSRSHASAFRASTRGSVVLEQQVAQALEQDMIGIALQPKVSLCNGELVGFEALARWREENGIAIEPQHFIPAAERAGLIDRLTEVVLEKSMTWLADHGKERDFSMAVNVSAISLRTDSLLQMVDAMCRRHQITPERLIVELTESEAVGEQTDALDTITQLRLRKVELAIDDFGVGYSSLVHLARLPFSELKIDRRFIGDLATSHESHAIVVAILGMAKGLGLRTVAEGVEDLETFNLLKSMGCDCAQGFFIGRPMPPGDAARWIDR